MGYVILARNPRDDRILAVTAAEADSDEPPIIVFDSEVEAERAAEDIPVCKAWPWVIAPAP